jgi:hypothetical protein
MYQVLVYGVLVHCIAVRNLRLHIVGLSTFLHKTSFSRRPTKARQNIYRVAIANNNTILDVVVLIPQGSARKVLIISDLP